MLLAIDVGNSTTVFGFLEPDTGEMELRWEVATDPQRSSGDWGVLLMPILRSAKITDRAAEGVIISSVVPPVTAALGEAIQTRLAQEPVVVSADRDLGIEVRVEHPMKVGTDRLVDAVAAYGRYGAPVMIVDAGTATKIDAVARGGVFLGGAIAPGIGIGLDALASRAAQLNAVPLEQPPQVIGRNTTEAIQSGLVLGHIAMIEGMVARVRAMLAADAPVVLTGGYGRLLFPLSTVFRAFEPDLALDGLRRLWLRWRAEGESSL
jgi:type III pantothenate kinase